MSDVSELTERLKAVWELVSTARQQGSTTAAIFALVKTPRSVLVVDTQQEAQNIRSKAVELASYSGEMSGFANRVIAAGGSDIPLRGISAPLIFDHYFVGRMARDAALAIVMSQDKIRELQEEVTRLKLALGEEKILHANLQGRATAALECLRLAADKLAG